MTAFIGMHVITRPTPPLRRRRRRALPRGEDFSVVDQREARAAGVPAATCRAAAPAPRRPRADPPQDCATYTCQCGFVFAATVSTSVACPHCGDAQAW
jgi:hypothetical protein